jgi:hypothetical protein
MSISVEYRERMSSFIWSRIELNVIVKIEDYLSLNTVAILHEIVGAH